MFLSTRRLFVLILFAALWLMATREISDPDFWWHLRTGQFIVETGTIPHTDIYSFTNPDKEWVTHEWLSEVLIYGIYRAGGFGLLIVAFAGIITACFALTYWRSEGRPFAAGLVVLVGAVATAPTWGVRPQILSLLLTGLFLLLLDRYQAGGTEKYLFPLVPLMLLWVNLHSGFALGLVIMAAYLAGLVVDHYHDGTLRTTLSQIRNLAIVLGLSGLAVMVNPNGARMYSYPLETLTSPAMQRYIQEWFSPDFHAVEWQPFALLLVGLIGASLWVRVRVPVSWLLLATVFAYAGLRSARNIPIFALIAIPILARQLNEILRARGWLSTRAGGARPVGSRPSRLVQGLNWILLLTLISIVALRTNVVINNQARVEQTSFPAAAVNYLATRAPAQKLYHSYNWGGYLIYRLYPEWRVYIDGRADVYGDQFIEDFMRIYRAESGWEQQLESQDIRLALLEPQSPLAAAMARGTTWRQVFGDDHSLVFERK